MKRDDIQAKLRSNPDAVFAMRPSHDDAGPVHVRGLRPHPSYVERWTVAEFKQGEHPDSALRGWRPASEGLTVTSREIVDVAAAEQVFAERREVVASQLAARSRAAQVVARLGLAGVDASQIGTRIVVSDVDALADLLDRLLPPG